jgi:hypothetical protein
LYRTQGEPSTALNEALIHQTKQAPSFPTTPAPDMADDKALVCHHHYQHTHTALQPGVLSPASGSMGGDAVIVSVGHQTASPLTWPVGSEVMGVNQKADTGTYQMELVIAAGAKGGPHTLGIGDSTTEDTLDGTTGEGAPHTLGSTTEDTLDSTTGEGGPHTLGSTTEEGEPHTLGIGDSTTEEGGQHALGSTPEDTLGTEDNTLDSTTEEGGQHTLGSTTEDTLGIGDSTTGGSTEDPTGVIHHLSTSGTTGAEGSATADSEAATGGAQGATVTRAHSGDTTGVRGHSVEECDDNSTWCQKLAQHSRLGISRGQAECKQTHQLSGHLEKCFEAGERNLSLPKEGPDSIIPLGVTTASSTDSTPDSQTMPLPLLEQDPEALISEGVCEEVGSLNECDSSASMKMASILLSQLESDLTNSLTQDNSD